MAAAQLGGRTHEFLGDRALTPVEMPARFAVDERSAGRVIEFSGDGGEVLAYPEHCGSGQTGVGRKMRDVDDLEVPLASADEFGGRLQRRPRR